MKDWHVHTCTKAWVRLEDSFSKIPVRHLSWIKPNMFPQDNINHPLIGPTLQAFQAACKKLNIYSSPGLLTPINRNPEFPPGLSNFATFYPDSNVSIHAEDVFEEGNIITHGALTSQIPGRPIPSYSYLQVRHFLLSYKPLSIWCRDQTPFESLRRRSKPQRHMKSDLYTLMFSNCD